MNIPIAFAIAAWVFFDLALLLALTGTINLEPGDRLLAALGLLALFFGVNAYASDSFIRHFGL